MCVLLEKCQKIQGWESVKVLWCDILLLLLATVSLDPKYMGKSLV